jgi:saccharopine dehydrogenase-like NADP-dependent oxidoreductase
MRALVLGGACTTGRWVVRDLTESDGVEEVVVADADSFSAFETAGWAAVRAGAKGTASVRGLVVDASDGGALRRAFERVDVVCNCAGEATNLEVMLACADTGTHYVDLGAGFQTTRDQLALHHRFLSAQATAVIGMGASPGTSNVMAALAAAELDTIESVEISLGRTELAAGSAALPAPDEIGALLDQVTGPAMTYSDGAFVEVPAMSGQQDLGLPPPVGSVRVGHSPHAAVATLPLSLASKGVRTVSCKLGFGRRLMERMDLLMGLGLASTRPLELDGTPVVPRDLLVSCIRAAEELRGAEAAPEDAMVISVRASGMRASGRTGERLPAEVLAECVMRPHPEWLASAGQRGGSAPASIAAQFLAHKVVDVPGVLPPEQAIPIDPYFDELARRGVEVSLTTRRPAVGGRAAERKLA